MYISAQYGQPGRYRAGGVTLSDGQSAALGLDVSGNLLVNVAAGGGAVASSFSNNQATVGTSAAALPSNALINGVIVQALSTNTVSIYIGGSGVTTSTGFELQPGQATSIAVNNTNLIYAISGSAAQGLCFIGS